MSVVVGKTDVTAVTREPITDHGTTADDIIEVGPLSSAETQLSSDNARAAKTRYRLFLKVLQKINMLFLVLFVCYFAWTISVNDGRVTGDRSNVTSMGNETSLQVDNISNFSGSRQIPYYSSSSSERQDKRYHPNIILPSHRKQSKRRRKKERHKKKRNFRVKKKFQSKNNVDDYFKLTVKSKRKQRKKACVDCKIRKRKGRKRFFSSKKVSALTLRKILEKVADETLSGARSGSGTISDLYEEDSNREDSGGKSWGGWSYEQHWVNIAGTDDLYDEEEVYQTVDHSIHLSPWSSWSECSTHCGPGQRERMRKCGSACKEVESMVCLNRACAESTEETSDENVKAIEEFYKWESEDFVPPLKLPEPEFLDPNVDACTNWVKCSRNYTKEFIRNSSLPVCPCSNPLTKVSSVELWDTHLNRSFLWVDASSHSDLVYKPGASTCIRSKLTPGAVTLAVQQCCYDSMHTLVTRGKSAGTPNLISPLFQKEKKNFDESFLIRTSASGVIATVVT